MDYDERKVVDESRRDHLEFMQELKEAYEDHSDYDRWVEFKQEKKDE